MPPNRRQSFWLVFRVSVRTQGGARATSELPCPFRPCARWHFLKEDATPGMWLLGTLVLILLSRSQARAVASIFWTSVQIPAPMEISIWNRSGRCEGSRNTGQNLEADTGTRSRIKVRDVTAQNSSSRTFPRPARSAVSAPEQVLAFLIRALLCRGRFEKP